MYGNLPQKYHQASGGLPDEINFSSERKQKDPQHKSNGISLGANIHLVWKNRVSALSFMSCILAQIVEA
jgi:hypothetical protein